MNLLAFDTSTETLSAAVQRDGDAALEHEAAGGPQASAALIPAVQSLLDRAGLELADLDAIVFGRGPGSFTGLRTACAVAQGLAFGARLAVLGVDTLLAIAEEARERCGAHDVLALLDARMGEVYSARYRLEGGAWRRCGEIVLGSPQQLQVPQGCVMAGNVFASSGELLPEGIARIDALPRAAAMLRIAPHLIAIGEAQDAAHAMPVYIRDKVAQTTDERAAARAATQPR